VVAEAMECLAGNGYIEDSGLPLLFRESPLNSIWEGSGTVNALDVLRALRREPEVLQAWLAEIAPARGQHAGLDRAVDTVLTSLADLRDAEAHARRLAAVMAACLQGALLLRHGDPDVADAFCASRLGNDWGGAFGTLPVGSGLAAVVDARPAPARQRGRLVPAAAARRPGARGTGRRVPGGGPPGLDPEPTLTVLAVVCAVAGLLVGPLVVAADDGSAPSVALALPVLVAAVVVPVWTAGAAGLAPLFAGGVAGVSAWTDVFVAFLALAAGAVAGPLSAVLLRRDAR
jgi:hypothetical protein